MRAKHSLLNQICFISVFLLLASVCYGQIIINHACTDLSQVPSTWIEQAKSNLHLAYQHTSHGSQITTGIGMLDTLNPGGLYAFQEGGGEGYLDYRDYAMQAYAEPPNDYMDLGQPEYTSWITATRNYLAVTSGINVIMWSWCGQLSDADINDVSNYLTNMNQLESEYSGITFIYMTGHLDGTGLTDILYRNNSAIRKYCNNNGKILFDFADIESYDPDGNYYLDQNATDACYYDGGNWADEWCANHPSECSYIDCSNGTGMMMEIVPIQDV